jgi:hypothetical protein
MGELSKKNAELAAELDRTKEKTRNYIQQCDKLHVGSDLVYLGLTTRFPVCNLHEPKLKLTINLPERLTRAASRRFKQTSLTSRA